jgi:hypothetical protein
MTLINNLKYLKGDKMKEQQLEINLDGISTQKNLDVTRGDKETEISKDSMKKIRKILRTILEKKDYTKKDIKEIVSLSKWVI